MRVRYTQCAERAVKPRGGCWGFGDGERWESMLRVVGLGALLISITVLGINLHQQRTATMLQTYRELSAVATRVANALQQSDFNSVVLMTEPSARATLTEGELQRRWRAFIAVIGAPQGWKLGQRQVIGHIATVRVHFWGAARAGAMQLKLRSNGREWRVTEVRFEP